MSDRTDYCVGDFVVPVDLPRRFVCYVAETSSTGPDDDQLLELQPLDGPWPAGTRLIRLDHMVRRATSAEIGLVRRASTDGDVQPSSQRRRHVRIPMHALAPEERHGYPPPKVA